MEEMMNDEIYIGTNGCVCLHSDIWGCRLGGELTQLVRHGDWSFSEFDGMRDPFRVRVDVSQIMFRVDEMMSDA
jgi:hypothetical protein